MNDKQAGKGRNLLLGVEGQIYLAACSHSPYTTLIRDAIGEYQRDLRELGNPWDLWMQKIEESVKLFAKLVNASPEEIFPSFSVSSALSAVMSAMRYDRKRRILVSDMEYPTTNYIFLAQEKRGAIVTTIHNRNHALSEEDYSKELRDDVLLTSAIHVSSLNGFRQEIRELSALAHDAGSLFYTDAYQSAGTTPVDVKSSDVDFLSSGNLKYLMGLPGIAFMYARKELIGDLEPTSTGWFSQKDPFLFGATSLNYADTADRFQSGTLSIPSVYASIAGMRAVLGIGPESIEKHIASLTALAMRLAEEYHLPSITPQDPAKRGAIVSFTVKRPHDLENKLRGEGIITSSRGTGIRIAPHFYNTEEDIERAVERISSMRDY